MQKYVMHSDKTVAYGDNSNSYARYVIASTALSVYPTLYYLLWINITSLPTDHDFYCSWCLWLPFSIRFKPID